MARFAPAAQQNTASVVTSKNLPFKNPYACAEGDFIYLNLETVQGLQKGMTALRDLALIIDISGSMNAHYVSGSVARLTKSIVDTIASFDDDGIDLLFFANGLVYEQNVKNADEVVSAIDAALASTGAYGSTMPTSAFRKFTDQLKQKNRPGTVLFLTDGAMDDGGEELKEFYKNVLHTQFRTRDKFYCYAVEFGKMAFNALSKLDGLYQPEQGEEDLFDLDSADNLEHITDVLKQVGGMSAIGSDVKCKATVDNGAVIDMVNADIIPGGITEIEGSINQIMSFRFKASQPFTFKVEIPGYDAFVAEVTPKGLQPDVKVS